MLKNSLLRRTERIVSGIVALTVCAGVMTGCGEAQKTETDEVVTISWLLPGDKPADLGIVQDEVNRIVEPEIGAKVEFRYIDSGSYTEKMNMSFSSQEIFDICFTGFVNPFDTTASKGAYMALDELLESTPELKQSIPEWLWKAGTRDGKIYAVPNYQICSGYFTSFMYTDLVKELGVDVESIRKPEDFEPVLEKIKQTHPEMYPWRIANGVTLWNQNYEEVASGVVVDTNSDELKAYVSYETENAFDAAEKTREWYEKGYIRSDAASVGDDNLDWINGKYGVFHATYKPGVETEFATKLGGREVTAFKVGDPYVTRTKCVAAMTAISKTSKNPEKAIKLIELVNTDKELYNLICFGIEGKHYEKVDDKHVKLNSDSGYYINASWKYGNQFNAYLLEGQADDVWEQTIKMNEEAKKSPLLGFVFDTTPVQSEIAQVNAVRGEYSALGNGTRDYHEFLDEYKSRLKAAGIEKIRDEVQKQLDEYAKTK